MNTEFSLQQHKKKTKESLPTKELIEIGAAMPAAETSACLMTNFIVKQIYMYVCIHICIWSYSVQEDHVNSFFRLCIYLFLCMCVGAHVCRGLKTIYGSWHSLYTM